MNNDTIIYTVQDLKEILKISKSMAYQLTRNKNFPKIKIGKRILIPADELKKWLLNQANDVSA